MDETDDSPYYKASDRIYILVFFLYLGGLMVVDWSGFMIPTILKHQFSLAYLVW